MSLCLENISRSIDESPGARSEVIREMTESASITYQERSTYMSTAEETTQICHNLHNPVAELNDYISETDQKIIASAKVFTERIEELKKKREECITLFNELMINTRDICQERNLLEVRKKIDYVNQWLKERAVVVDETMKEELTATRFDQSADPRKEQDLLGLWNGSEEDTEGQVKAQLRSFFGVKSNIVGLTCTSESQDINGCTGKPLTDEKIAPLLPIPDGNY